MVESWISEFSNRVSKSSEPEEAKKVTLHRKTLLNPVAGPTSEENIAKIVGEP
jgi:hypothetical protein